MLNTSFCKRTTLISLFLLFPIIVMGRPLYMDGAAEADRITVRMDRGAQTGTAKITGCSVCPMELRIDPGTRFFRDNQPVRQRQIRFLSTRSGTVTYHKEQQRALKILW